MLDVRCSDDFRTVFLMLLDTSFLRYGNPMVIGDKILQFYVILRTQNK